MVKFDLIKGGSLINKIKISVIVPVYNVEKYLRQCLDSIVNQTLKEIEIICVNDGSTDSSPKILEEYAQKDKRIKIINKENEGLGAARKTGLDEAIGEFVSFIDSDDFVELNAYDKLYRNAILNDSDVILLNVKFYDESGSGYNWDGYDIAKCFDSNIDFNNFVFNYTHIKDHLLNRYFSACAKMYKTKFLKGYDDFYFPKHVFFEDVPFHVQVLLRASKISFCTDELYVYRISNSNSISHLAHSSRKVFDIFTVVAEVEKILNENEKMDEFRYEFFIFKIAQLIQWFDKCGTNYKREFFELIKQNFEKIDLKDGDILDLDDYTKDKYQNILNSDSYSEFELLEKFNQLKSLHHNELQRQKEECEWQLTFLKKQHDDQLIDLKTQHDDQLIDLKTQHGKQLTNLKKQYEKEIKIREQKIQEIILSNSWKLTKPLRKLGKSMRDLK